MFSPTSLNGSIGGKAWRLLADLFVNFEKTGDRIWCQKSLCMQGLALSVDWL
jgi:hypothetical protein